MAIFLEISKESRIKIANFDLPFFTFSKKFHFTFQMNSILWEMTMAFFLSNTAMISLCLYQMVNATSVRYLCCNILSSVTVRTHWTTVTGSCVALSTLVTGRLARPAHAEIFACSSAACRSQITWLSLELLSYWGAFCFYVCWDCHFRLSTLCDFRGLRNSRFNPFR